MIRYPEPAHLDTGDCRDDYSYSLYLVPAEETEDGVPAVERHGGYGNRGEPAMAWHRRWLHLGECGSRTCGVSVLEALRSCEDELLAVASDYAGSAWDGNNWRGRWADDNGAQHRLDELEDAWHYAESCIKHYLDAASWYEGDRWEDLCVEVGVDPERALGRDWQEVAAEVARILEPQQEEPVYGTADYALEQAEAYRSRPIVTAHLRAVVEVRDDEVEV